MPELLLCQQPFDKAAMPFEVDVDSSTLEAQINRDIAKISGNCPSAFMLLKQTIADGEHIATHCPEWMPDMHAKGAPEAIECAVELMHFAEATKG